MTSSSLFARDARGKVPFLCVDASFALKVVLPEEESQLVVRKWEDWQAEGITVVAPWLFAFEVMAVLRQKVARKNITTREGLAAWETLCDLGVELRHHEDLWERAWDLATRYHRPTTYDTSYLALAEILDCELWTSDRRFLKALNNREPRVKWLFV